MESSKRRRGVRCLSLLLLFLLLIGALLYDSYSRIVTTEYKLNYARLPASFDGFRIVVLSDLHAAEFGENNIKLVSYVKEANPDIIAVIGDIIDKYEKPGTDVQLNIAGTLVRALIEIAPVYYVTGNHEWDSGAIGPLLFMLGESGAVVLRNQYVKLEAGGDAILIAGTDDPNGPADMVKPEEFVRRMYESEGRLFTVMLEHRNGHLALYNELSVDLLLSGHAHGGIIRIPFTDGLIGPNREFLPTYTNGVYTMGDTNMVVSRGIGNHTGWPRFLNNPHVVVVELAEESS